RGVTPPHYTPNPSMIRSLPCPTQIITSHPLPPQRKSARSLEADNLGRQVPEVLPLVCVPESHGSAGLATRLIGPILHSDSGWLRLLRRQKPRSLRRRWFLYEFHVPGPRRVRPVPVWRHGALAAHRFLPVHQFCARRAPWWSCPAQT